MFNPFNEYYSKQKKITKLFLNKYFNNIVYAVILTLIISAFIILITFLSLPSIQKNSSLLWIAISFILFVMIFYYVYQFIKRKIKYKLEAQINFRWLYEKNLRNKEKISSNLIYCDLYNQFFINLHVSLMKSQFQDANLGNEYEAYSFEKEKQKFIFSICNIKDYQKKWFQKVNNTIQIIIKRDNYKINSSDFLLSKNQIFNNLKDVFNLEKQADNEFNLYLPNNQIKHWKQINECKKIINDFNDNNVNLSILVLNQEVYYIFETKLQINFENQNWFNKNFNYFINLYSNYMLKIEKMFKLL